MAADTSHNGDASTTTLALVLLQQLLAQGQSLRDFDAGRQHLAAIIEHVPVAICVMRGADFRYELANRAYQVVAPGKAMLGHTLAEVWPELVDELIPMLRSVMESGEPRSAEDVRYQLRRSPDGPLEDAYFTYTWIPLKIPGQEPSLVTVTRETTEQVRARQRVSALTEQLADDHHFLASIIESVPAGIAVFRGPNFVFDIVNPAYHRFGPGKQMAGRPFTEVWPEVADVLLPVFRRVLETGEPFHAVDSLFPVQRSSGGPLEEAYWTFSLLKMPPDESGEDRILNLAIETTERKRAERHRQEFLELAAHEMKTPLATLRGYVQMLVRRGGHDDEASQALAALDRQSRRLVRLVQRLVDASRIQNGQWSLTLSRLDLCALAQEAVEVFQSTQRARVRLAIDCDSAVFVEVDRAQVLEVIQSLLDNAARYGSETEPIEVAVQVSKSEAVVSVEDHGPGISKEHQKRLFEPWYQTAPMVRPTAGMGLSLYISREIVRLHGGRMWLESDEGRGSSFHVALPLA